MTVSSRMLIPTPTGPERVDQVEQPAGDAALIGCAAARSDMGPTVSAARSSAAPEPGARARH